MKAGGISGLLPALGALALALALASGLVPRAASEGGGPLLVIDASPSCEPPGDLPATAFRSDEPDLGALLAAAATRAPGRPLLLHTDGCAPGGAPALPAGTTVDVVLRPRRDNARLLDLRAPERVGVGEPFSVAVSVGRTAGPAGRAPVAVSVTLWRDGLRVGAPGYRVELAAGATRTVRIADRVDAPGLVRYRGEVRGGPGPTVDDTFERLVRVGDEPTVLAIGEVPATLDASAGTVSPAQAGARLSDPAFVARVDAIVVAAPLEAEDAQRALAAAVDAGAGLLVLDPRGLEGGPLERVLPLTTRPPEGRALLVLLDWSGSMAAHLEELQRAVARLRARFAPDDRVAAIGFRDAVVFSTPWEAAADAAWPLRRHRPSGNTRLQPALDAARTRLAGVAARTRRLIVVSDGRWEELRDGRADGLAATLTALAAEGVDPAVLLLGDDPPDDARALFPRVLAGDGDLARMLLALEEAAPDRFVEGPREAVAGPSPAWLGDALSEGPYRDLVRLYPRGRGEAIPLRAGDLPVVGARRAGGRVVQLAPRAGSNATVAEALPRLVRAVARPLHDERLEAHREGGALRLVGYGAHDGPFRVAGDVVPSRPTGPARHEALLDDPPPAGTVVSWGGATLLLEAPGRAELAGLTPCAEVAAGVAARSGGRYHADGTAPPRPRPPRPLPAALALPALLLVLLAARVRRSA